MEIIEEITGTKRITLNTDKNYNTLAFVSKLRSLTVSPHVPQRYKGTAIDKRTIRHVGYETSQKVRKRVEEIFK